MWPGTVKLNSEQPLNPLPIADLRRRCDPSIFPFETTETLEPLDGFMGQDRALAAMNFGTSIEHPGFHLFILGTPGTGRHTAVRKYLDALAATRPAPTDWVYVNDFSLSERPKALSLPAGRAVDFRDGMAAAIDDLAASLPTILESDEYRRRQRTIDEEFENAQEAAFEGVRSEAEARDIALVRTPFGFALVPMRAGEVVKSEEFQAWPEETRETARIAISELGDSLRAVLERVPRLDKERRQRLRELNREFAAIAVDHALDDMLTAFADLPLVATHLDAVRQDLVENSELFMRPRGEEANGTRQRQGSSGSRRFKVNVLVANDHAGVGAPVVHETNPTLPNLVGRIEHLQQFGTLVTDFLLIQAGALHRANGGFLLIDALKVLTEPLAWEALKRALRSGRIVIESLAEHFSLLSTVFPKAEPIPFSAKVVMFGERYVYDLLCELDPEFPEIFTVAVDFDDVVERSSEEAHRYARSLAALVTRDGLLPVDRGGVAYLLEHTSRLAEDAERFSVRMAPVADLLRESDYWARQDNASAIMAVHVRQAEQAAKQRQDRLREKCQESAIRNILLIDTDGERTGQVNGLSIVAQGNRAFGRPSRITARVRLGSGKLVDIERESELGGPLHSKGVLILSGLLTANYAIDWPMSLAASLVVEQSYGGVEGDSASAAELCALLSAIAEIPLRQDLAVTGSINQFGEMQAIGGVNEKVEGFFDLCTARGLTGRQGVIIPKANVQHLMLRDDVVDACRSGGFAVYAVGLLDEAMALLTGGTPGARGADGLFPPGTINGLVEARLIAMAKRRLALGEHQQAIQGDT
jgi:lon-related putative ATP-dependent protease